MRSGSCLTPWRCGNLSPSRERNIVDGDNEGFGMLRLVLAYLTFPGVPVHEFAHAWACRRIGIRVVKVCYLRLGNPLGYVMHERPQYALQHIMVAVAPIFVSTAVAMVVSLAAAVMIAGRILPEYHYVVLPLLLWLSFSVAMHSFPSSGDADALWNEVRSSRVGCLAKLMLVPAVGMIRLAGIGSRVWLDMLYSVIIVALPPLLVAVAMPYWEQYLL